MKQEDLRVMFTNAFNECVYITHCVISWPLVSYSFSLFSYEDSRKQKQNLMTLKQRMKKISK